MSRTGIRFRPPRLALSPEVRWLFLRAFGPRNAPFAEPIRGSEAVELARLFEVAPRIAQRQGREVLARDVGEEYASQLMGDLRAAAFVVLQRVAAARDLARIAGEMGVELVFLKFLALHYSQVTSPGSREAADIDVLVSREHLARLHDAVRESGYSSRELSSSEHHLPLLDHPKHGPVEIHRFIPGVAVGNDGSYATVDSLRAGSLLQPIADLPGRCYAPLLEVQAAHAIAHGVAQHGTHPDAYSTARVLSDLIDLQAASELGADIFGRAQGWIGHAVSEAETAALRDLCGSLSRGVFPCGQGGEGASAETPEALFLSHVVSGLLDEDYRKALNLRFLDPRLTDRPQALARGAVIRRAFFPSRGEIDEIYGRPKSPAGYAARRLMRPFDLLRRVLRDGVSLVRLRLKQPRHDDR